MKSFRFADKIFAVVLLGGMSATASAQMMINGAGATFPYPIYSKWFDEYAKVDPSVRFNYQSIGSGGGQKQILAQTVDFGASDGPMSDENLAKAPGKLLHIPTVAGADVVAYNLPGNRALKFDAETVAGIFLGQIKKWNDPKVTALNAGVTFVKPSIESITAALATADIPDDFRFSITNAPGADAYPIAGATWLLVYEQQKDAAKGRKLVEFLKWAAKDGEKMAKDLQYAPMPDNLQQRVLKRIDEIKM